MSDADEQGAVEEANEKYSRVDADDVVEDAAELFEKPSEGPPTAANPEAFGLIDPGEEQEDDRRDEQRRDD